MNAPLPSADLKTVEALISAGRLADADRACDAVLSREPAHPAARYYRAYCRFHARRYDEARALLDALLRDHPAIPLARYLLGDTHRQLGRFADAAEAYGVAIARDFGLDASESPEARLAGIVEFVATAPRDRWKAHEAALDALGTCLEKSGFPIGSPTLQERLGACVLPLARDGSFRDRVRAARAALHAVPGAPAAWMRPLAEGALLAWLRRALEEGAEDNALDLENLIYTSYVVGTENQEHFRAGVGLWQDAMRAAGRRMGERHPLPPRRAAGPLPRIAFFVHNVTMLAHTTALVEVLEGHHELPAPMMEPWLFYFDGQQAAIERFQRAGVRTEALCPPGAPDQARALVALRRRIAEEGIEAVAWISLALAMPFAFGMRVAPRQVWWAMKYHALDFPEIDDYVTGGGETGIHTIQGRPWRVGPVVAAKWTAPELAPEAQRIRNALGPASVVFGSFGRTEKLNSPAFLDAVVEILRAVPDAMFLWTGRTQLPAIQKHFEDAGVAARCRFIGWVNTRLYAQVIDVFLDSFPFPNGFTLYEAMAAGKPAVLFASEESDHGGINAIVGSMLASDPRDSEDARVAQSIFRPADGASLYLRAATPAEYVAYALRLAREPSFRTRAGEAARDFIEKVMTNRRRAAQIYVHLLLGRDLPAGLA